MKGTATNERVRSRRQSSLDESTVQYLEKRLEQRPDKQELQGRNILKGLLLRNLVPCHFEMKTDM